MTFGVSLTAELRGSDTTGITDDDGTRPTGDPGNPADYDVEETVIHDLPARRSFALLFYREGEAAYFHSVALRPGGSTLVWVEEDGNCMYLLTGGMTRQALLDTVESMYRSERSE